MKPTVLRRVRAVVLPIVLTVALVFFWHFLVKRQKEPLFPAPMEVWDAFHLERKTGRLWRDVVASLFHVGAGYFWACLAGIPLGMALGRLAPLREATLPLVNFLRSVSPIAWIPFAVFWFGIGDKPVVFLIFLSVCPLVALSTLAAVASVPAIYPRVGREYGLGGLASWFGVFFPAILPQTLTALRVAAGTAWVVVVAAEMVSRSEGLGFLILDARNGQMLDLAVVGIVLIGLLGVLIDRALMLLALFPAVRWGYER